MVASDRVNLIKRDVRGSRSCDSNSFQFALGRQGEDRDHVPLFKAPSHLQCDHCKRPITTFKVRGLFGDEECGSAKSFLNIRAQQTFVDEDGDWSSCAQYYIANFLLGSILERVVIMS